MVGRAAHVRARARVALPGAAADRRQHLRRRSASAKQVPAITAITGDDGAALRVGRDLRGAHAPADPRRRSPRRASPTSPVPANSFLPDNGWLVPQTTAQRILGYVPVALGGSTAATGRVRPRAGLGVGAEGDAVDHGGQRLPARQRRRHVHAPGQELRRRPWSTARSRRSPSTPRACRPSCLDVSGTIPETVPATTYPSTLVVNATSTCDHFYNVAADDDRGGRSRSPARPTGTTTTRTSSSSSRRASGTVSRSARRADHHRGGDRDRRRCRRGDRDRRRRRARAVAAPAARGPAPRPRRARGHATSSRTPRRLDEALPGAARLRRGDRPAPRGAARRRRAAPRRRGRAPGAGPLRRLQRDVRPPVAVDRAARLQPLGHRALLDPPSRPGPPVRQAGHGGRRGAEALAGGGGGAAPGARARSLACRSATSARRGPTATRRCSIRRWPPERRRGRRCDALRHRDGGPGRASSTPRSSRSRTRSRARST